MFSKNLGEETMTCAFNEQHLGEMVGDLTKMLFELRGFVGSNLTFCPISIEAGAVAMDELAKMCGTHDTVMTITRKSMLCCLNTYNFRLDMDVNIVEESILRTSNEVREILWTMTYSSIHLPTAMNILFFTRVWVDGLKAINQTNE